MSSSADHEHQRSPFWGSSPPKQLLLGPSPKKKMNTFTVHYGFISQINPLLSPTHPPVMRQTGQELKSKTKIIRRRPWIPQAKSQLHRNKRGWASIHGQLKVGSGSMCKGSLVLWLISLHEEMLGFPRAEWTVQFSHSVVSDSLRLHGLQHARPACPSPTPGACSNSCPLSQWCHPNISSSVGPFSFCLQSFPASESFPMNQFLASGGQSTGVSASTSILPVNIQDWFPLGLTVLISLPSKGLSRVFSSNTI